MIKTKNLYLCELCRKICTYTDVKTKYTNTVEVSKNNLKKRVICRKDVCSNAYFDVFSGTEYKIYSPFPDESEPVCIDTVQPLLFRKKRVSKKELIEILDKSNKE